MSVVYRAGLSRLRSKIQFKLYRTKWRYTRSSSFVASSRRETFTGTRAGMNSTPLGSVTRVIGRIPILDMEPAVECGRRPARAVAGETFEVSATIFREGHGIINAAAVLRDPDRQASPPLYMRELAPGTDRWGTDVTVTGEGVWRFHVEAWADPIASWHHDAAIKIPAGQDVELMLAEGALLFERAARRIPQPPGRSRPAAARNTLRKLAAKMRDRGLTPWDRLAATEDPLIASILLS